MKYPALIPPLVCLALLTSCARDQPAPDCFFVVDGVCEIPEPDPIPSGLQIACEELPNTSIGAPYAWIPDITGASTADLSDWEADNLPDGLSMDAATGAISGVAEAIGLFEPIVVRVTDNAADETKEFECGPIEVQERLNANPLITKWQGGGLPCIERDDDILDFLEGGAAGVGITCRMPEFNGDSNTCKWGEGNGLFPAGLEFDEENCTFSGSITEDEPGLWMWAVEISQGQYSTWVPFCEVNGDVDNDLYHQGTHFVDDMAVDTLNMPDVIVFGSNTQLAPDDDDREFLAYGDPEESMDPSDPRFEVLSPDCMAAPNPEICSWSVRWSTTCSPLDRPLGMQPSQVNAGGGVNHWIYASDTPDCQDNSGSMVDCSGGEALNQDHQPWRAWIQSWQMTWCTTFNVDGIEETNGVPGNQIEECEASGGTTDIIRFNVVGLPEI